MVPNAGECKEDSETSAEVAVEARRTNRGCKQALDLPSVHNPDRPRRADAASLQACSRSLMWFGRTSRTVSGSLTVRFARCLVYTWISVATWMAAGFLWLARP
jgi:hypothetical protein